MNRVLRPVLVVFLTVLAASVLLTGCGIDTTSTAAPAIQHLSITGSVHGGQQPVSGARIYVFQAGNTSYYQRSVDLVGQFGSNPAPGTAIYDGNYGASYITADSNGNFTITGDYKCAGTGPVYLLATQGNPGLGSGKSNPALAEMAVLGPCASLSTLSSTLHVSITEVSTVAGVYALAGFMVAPNYLSSNGANSALSLTGINNAAATAMAMTNPGNGLALATTASGGTVPVAKINLLADMLAACINSDGTGTACSTLLTEGAPTSSSRAPDTVSALLNIAKSPAPAGLANLYGLVTPTSPYQPYPSTQPTDLTLALTYTVQFPYPDNSAPPTYIGYTPVNPNLPTIDAAGDIIVPGVQKNPIGGGQLGLAGSTLIFNNLGMLIAANGIFASTNGPLFAANKWAIDASGNGWAGPTSVQSSNTSFARLTPSSAAISTYTQAFPGNVDDAAIDGAGNIYLPDNGSATIQEYNSSGTSLGSVLAGTIGVAVDKASNVYATDGFSVISKSGSSTSGGVSHPGLLAVDAFRALWAGNSNNTLSRFTTSGSGSSITLTAASPASGYSGAGLAFNTTAQPYVPVVIDGASSGWVPNYAGQSISGFVSNGTPLSPAATTSPAFAGGFQTGCNSKGLAIDGSGNVWVTCDNPSYATYAQDLTEFIGLATPVATPILPNQFGTLP